MKKSILLVLIGMILGGSIIGVLAYSYSAKDISYNPSNTSWNVNNIKDAIDSLKNNEHISASGQLTTTNSSTIHNIDIGFRPNKVIIFIPNSNTNHSVLEIYDNERYSTEFKSCWSNNSKVVGVCETLAFSEFGFSLTNTGFRFRSQDANSEGLTYWYAMK